MRSRLSLVVALFAALAAPAVAGGGDSRPANVLFPGAEYQVRRFTGETVPFNVEVDLSRTRVQRQGPLHILVTAVTPQNEVVSLTSRSITAGEKRTWSGRLPASGVVVIYVLDNVGVATSTQVRRDARPVRLVITGDEKGDFGVSDGRCSPRTGGICGGGGG